MKILNNINGNSILIDKIRLQENNLIYSVFEFGNNLKTESKVLKFENDFKLIDFENQNIKSFDEIYLKMSELIENFELSEDMQNWTITQGYENPTTIRVYLPAKVLNDNLDSGNDLDLLITKMKPLNSFKQTLENGNIQYLSFLENEDRLILEQYPTIIIEDKI